MLKEQVRVNMPGWVVYKNMFRTFSEKHGLKFFDVKSCFQFIKKERNYPYSICFSV